MSFTNPEINPSSDAPLLTLGLIDSVTDQILMGYEDLGNNQTININDLNITDYNIAAFINSDHINSNAVTSVKFESSLGNRTENVAPYALFGDRNGDYFGKPLSEGDYSLMATAYSGKNASGDVLGVVTVGYTVINSTTEPPLDPPSIFISDASADENAKLATFTVSLSETSNEPITVDYATVDDTATAGSDYRATNGTLFFPAGETWKTFSVDITDNDVFEGDEAFTVNLSNVIGEANIADGIATGMIQDNDPSSPPSSLVLDSSLPKDKLMEQKMLLRIVPDGSQTHQAVKNGSWFDQNTWANGIIPTEGARVHIPAHLTVEYDGQSDVPLWTIRVDGNLNFSRTKDSKLVVDTLAVMYSGQLNIGSKEQAISKNVKAEIVFADDQRSLDDPMAMGLGLVSIGEVNIHGQEKRSYLKVAKDPLKGDTSLNLAEVPAGWKVGDRIVLTGTQYNPDWFHGNNLDQSEDETLIITAISGQTITVDKPLQYDHDTPRADLKAYVANLSRNVVLRSEETEDISQRGHVMLMHNDNVDIRFAQFQELGRTDKSRKIDNSTDNVNGRYALHLHRQGVALDNNPAIVVGNSVEGSPGWGYVHHSSYAVMDHNVAYDVFGGAFIAESGDETGRWEHNIAIKGTGVGGREGKPKSAAGKNNLSAANNGTGFYFQGRLVHNQNNIAASMPGWGFVYFHRRTGTSVNGVDSSTIEEPLTARYKSGVSIDSPTIQGFVNNEAFATGKGLEVIKNHANQHHDSRTILDGFLAWEVQNGVALDYTGHYTLEDFELIAHEASSAKYWTSSGLGLGNRNVDIVVNDLYVDGFYKGVYIHKSNNEIFNDLPGNNLFVDYEAVNVNVRMETNGKINGHVTEINSSEIQSRMVSLELDPTSDLHIDSSHSGQERITLQGTKTDSTGTFTYGILASHADLQNIHNMDLGSLLQKGYYTLPNGQKATIFPELISDRIFGDSFVQDLVITIGDSIKTEKLPYLGQLNATDVNQDGIWEVNSAPYAGFDAVKVEKNGSVVFSVFGNDSDIDGDKFALQDFTNVGDGTLELLNGKTGTFRYTPKFNHDGYDYFNYTIADPNGSNRSSIGRVQLKIETMD